MALHRLGQFAAEEEPQPIADDRGGQVTWQSGKALEEERNLVRRDPQAMITYGDLDHAPLASRTQFPTTRSLRLRHDTCGDFDRRPWLGGLERVREQVGEDLLQGDVLAPDRQVTRHVDVQFTLPPLPFLWIPRRRCCRHRLEHGDDLWHVLLGALVESSRIKDALDELGKVVARLASTLDHARAAFRPKLLAFQSQQLDIALH